ncbi:MAG: hypothetical protein ACOY4Q_00005 [Bacillota bacterium]
MVKIYAQLNENGVCIGVSQLSGVVEQSNMIEIPALDTDYLWKKYENGQWSAEKFEPQTTAPITEFEELKQRQELMQAALDDLILGGGAL